MPKIVFNSTQLLAMEALSRAGELAQEVTSDLDRQATRLEEQAEQIRVRMAAIREQASNDWGRFFADAEVPARARLVADAEGNVTGAEWDDQEEPADPPANPADETAAPAPASKKKPARRRRKSA